MKSKNLLYSTLANGDVAQIVKRSLSMREVRGSISRISTFCYLVPVSERNDKFLL